MKLGKHLKHLPFFAMKFIFEIFDFFFDFTVHGGMIRGKTQMDNYQHFCHECK
jgi:hypothetical protein